MERLPRGGVVLSTPVCSCKSDNKWRLMATGTDITSGKEVAIKLTDNREGPEMLRDEAETYRRLAGEVGIPQVYWFGEEVSYYVLVFELLGPSLEDLFNYCDRRFSLKTILLIAEQAVSRIERIYKKFLHSDIKPDNFLLGLSRQGNMLYTIDFGLAREFSDKVEYRGYKGLGFQSTDQYASIKCHNSQGIKITYCYIIILALTLTEQS